MRVASYNVRYFGHGLKGLASTAASKRRIAEALAGLESPPDVVALQEVETASLRAGLAHRKAHPQELQLEAFVRHLTAAFQRRGRVQPYRAIYYPAHVYALGAVRLYTTGLAMLVNTQTAEVLADNADAPRGITFHASESLRWLKQTRIAAHLHLADRSGRRFHLFNTHLSLPTAWTKAFWTEPGRLGHGANQLAEARAVVDYAQATAGNEPMVVMGDFNSTPASPVYDWLTGEGGLRGAQAVLRQIDPTCRDGFATAGFMGWRMHLDHVFGRGVDFLDVEGTHAFDDQGSPFSGLSDHTPVLARFDLG